MKDCIVITSPSLVKEVVRDQDVIFANRGNPTVAVRSFLFGTMDISFSNYGHELRKMRKVFVSEMMNNGDTLKGGKSNTVNAEFRALRTEQMEHLGAPNTSDLFPLLARYDLQGIERRMKIITRRCENILDSAINNHNSGENNKQKGFLGHLLHLTKFENPATSLTLPQVKALLMDAVIGGTDTTATTVEWVVAEMLQHPQVMRKVQEELTEIVGLNNIVEEVHLPKLKYLKAVVKETLRLHPSIPLLFPHCPIKASISSIPFGSGRRICPGISLAERNSMLVLASLLHSFHWNLPNGSVEVDTSERFGIVVKKAKPLFAVPVSPVLFGNLLENAEHHYLSGRSGD
ncbi:cytochrome P450 76C2-like [Chenopodium quinoa]|uniref:cytochrome P450 76C2-like n=1 Tax=Chenopodium quinoa TaxID=63459 RepID=UPI000B789EBC|nr:cytochrome P450 76C2-like [Chenopodium quinoa]